MNNLHLLPLLPRKSLENVLFGEVPLGDSEKGNICSKDNAGFYLQCHECFEVLQLETEMQMKIGVEVDGKFLLEVWWNLPYQCLTT